MPFTFSHPVAVFPAKYLPERAVSFTALVIGSVTPDFEYFFRMADEAKFSHTWGGLFWFDLPVGLLLFYVYNAFVKAPLIDHLPLWLNKRFSSFKNMQTFRPTFLVIVICLIVGAATHLLWDSFTHPRGYYVKHIRGLRHPVIIWHHAFSFYNILQHTSSLIGACIILIVIIKLPAGISTQKQPIIYYWLMVFAIAIVVLMIRILTGLNIYIRYGDAIVSLVSGSLLGVLIASVYFSKKAVAVQQI